MLSCIVRPIDERTDELALVEEVHPLRRRIDEVDVAGMQIVGRQKLADEDGDIHGAREMRRKQPPPGGA